MCSKHSQSEFGTKNILGKHLLSKNSTSFPTLFNEDLNTCRRTRSLLVGSRQDIRQQEIMVFVFIISDWIFVLMNATIMIPCARVSQGIDQRGCQVISLFQRHPICAHCIGSYCTCHMNKLQNNTNQRNLHNV